MRNLRDDFRSKVPQGIVLWVCMILATQSIVLAQDAPWADGLERPLQSDITAATIDLLDESLDLSAEQRTLAERVVEEHVATFGTFASSWRPIVRIWNERMEPHASGSVKRYRVELEREEHLAQAADQQAALDNATLQRLRMLLNEEQIEQWDTFRRTFDRRRWLGRMPLFPEETIHLDLLLDEVVQQQEHADELDEGVLTVVTQWSLGVDAHLTALCKQQIKTARMMRRQYADITREVDGVMSMVQTPEKMKTSREREWRSHRRVRDQTRHAKEALITTLPGALQQPFIDAYDHKAVAWRIHHEKYPGKPFIKSIRTLASLSDEQSEAIDVLVAMFRESTRQIYRRYLVAYDDLVEARHNMTTTAEQRDRQSKIDDVVHSRSIAERRFIDDVWLILTPEQQITIGSKPTVGE